MHPEQKENFKRHLGKLYADLKQKLNLKATPRLFLMEDKPNAEKLLGKTGYYDPISNTIRLFVTERHPKDVLRSFAHEVIHHWQNENGKLADTQTARAEQADPKYAQNDPVLRKMEKQAYLLGNMIFRDWEDKRKTTNEGRIVLKSLLAEGPEVLKGEKWYAETCIGPFVIFKHQGKLHYAFGDRKSDSILFDDGELFKVNKRDRGATHSWVRDGIDVRYNDITEGRDLDGRLWVIEGKVYVGLWLQITELKSLFDANQLTRMLFDIVKNFTGITDKNRIYIQPYTDNPYDDEGHQEEGPFLTLPQLKDALSGTEASKKSVDPKMRDLHKMLHTLPPSEKSLLLKKLGVKAKVDKVPDWKKRQAAGVDEKHGV